MKKYAVIASVVCLLLLSTIFSSVFAKNFNLPQGQKIEYFSQGEGYIAVPAGKLYTNSPATTLKIVCNDGEDGTFGSADTIGIFEAFPEPNPTEFLPMAWFVASPNPAQSNAQVDFYRMLFKGLPPAVVAQVGSSFINNTKAVSDTLLKVERHGNTITAMLNATQTVIYATGINQGRPANIPGFSVEFNKVAGNVHFAITNTFDPTKGLSGYTQIVEASGFQATGLFSCTSTRWTASNLPMTNCFISMHEISTYIPPNTP